jgi:hypothetical protein
VYNTQNYWTFRELLSARVEHMLHVMEMRLRCGCVAVASFPWCALGLTVRLSVATGSPYFTLDNNTSIEMTETRKIRVPLVLFSIGLL